MIKRIDIEKFGQFEKFNWTRDRVPDMKQLNVIYGRNYSGKTTLSRLLAKLVSLDVDPTEEQFVLTYFDKTAGKEVKIVSHNNENISEKLKVIIYNDEFVAKHLGFLSNHNEHIDKFTVVELGEGNISLKTEENNIRTKLYGSTDITDETAALDGSLFKKRIDKTISLHTLTKELTDRTAKKEKLLTDKASEIASNRQFYLENNNNYNKANLRPDIAAYEKNIISLDEAKVQELKNTITSVVKSDLNRISLQYSFYDLYMEVLEVIQKCVQPSKTLERLISQSSEVEEWVKKGKDIHQNNSLTTCSFCGNELTDNILSDLDKHFSEEYDSLYQDAEKLILKVKNGQRSLDDLLIKLNIDVYDNFTKDFAEVKRLIDAQIRKVTDSLDYCVKLLEDKRRNLALIPEFENIDENLDVDLSNFNKIVDKHNNMGKNLDTLKQDAKRKLKLYFIGTFYEHFSELLINESHVNNEVSKIEEEIKDLNNNIQSLQRRLIEIDSQYQSESLAVLKVNKLLKDYFEDVVFELRSINDTNVVFKIFRNNQIATNLSLGERNIISLVYFIARMESELDQLNSRGITCSVFIDDPVNSVDRENIYYHTCPKRIVNELRFLAKVQ